MRTPKLLASGTATINMTPMIDVVFLLIIFFLVSSHLAKQENMLALDLPEAASGLDDLQDRDTLIINVLKNGTWQIGGTNANEVSFQESLETRATAAENALRLRIRTDRDVQYERIEPILRIAAAAGIGDIVFSVFEDRNK